MSADLLQSLRAARGLAPFVDGVRRDYSRHISGGAWGPLDNSPLLPLDNIQESGASKLNRVLAFARGMALDEVERTHFGVRGLVPPAVQSIKVQSALALKQIRACSTKLDQYTLLSDLQHDNETLFFHVISSNVKECMPIIYTPTVGEACQKFGHIMKRPKGMYLSIKDKGNVANVLANWPQAAVEVVVMTDGERILGLGDLGTYGMGIPIGKLNLYTVAGGINPQGCLPLTLDVGTENEQLLKDEFYTGLRHHRVRGPSYDEFVDEVMSCISQRWPNVLIQFEDFGNRNAFRLLEKYKDSYLTFNDDIQGTASVALAGYLSALRVKQSALEDEIILFQGAGEAGCGIADLLVVSKISRALCSQHSLKKMHFPLSATAVSCPWQQLTEICASVEVTGRDGSKRRHTDSGAEQDLSGGLARARLDVPWLTTTCAQGQVCQGFAQSQGRRELARHHSRDPAHRCAL